MEIIYKKVPAPQKDVIAPVMLDDATMAERREKVLERMRQNGLDQLVIYCDVEHAYNFMYLTGFFTRFEEALLILNKDGSAAMMLGNENLNKCDKSRLTATPVHVSLFSLPNQPNRTDRTFHQLLAEAGIMAGKRIGLVGWKLFTSTVEENPRMFDIPAYIVDAIREIAGDDSLLMNATALMIGAGGARTTNNANEIAHYEYGASLASDGILDACDILDVGISELELGDVLVRNGQHTNIVTIAASGPRFIKANMFPTDNTVKLGDTISLTVGYAGGASSRAGFAVRSAKDLPDGQKDYLERVAIPYFTAYAAWLENVRIGMTGGQIFGLIDHVLPRSRYHWSLCPGHLTAEEEWLCSPVYEGSEEVLCSGMIFQIDIIPSIPGYGGVNAESTVVLADAGLKTELREQYPEMYRRMMRRRDYLRNELNIRLSEDILPMCGTVAYMRPFLLEKEYALAVAVRD